MKYAYYLTIIIFVSIACQSMLQNKGQVYYVNTQHTIDKTNKIYYTNSMNIGDFINYHLLNQAFRVFDSENINNENIEKREVIKVEGINEIITLVTSAIAGVYCAIKAIMTFIKNLKK